MQQVGIQMAHFVCTATSDSSSARCLTDISEEFIDHNGQAYCDLNVTVTILRIAHRLRLDDLCSRSHIR